MSHLVKFQITPCKGLLAPDLSGGSPCPPRQLAFRRPQCPQEQSCAALISDPRPAPTTPDEYTLSFLPETAPTSAYSSPARSLGDTGITPLSPSHIAVRNVSIRVGGGVPTSLAS